MKKKTQRAILMVLLAVLCILVLSGCKNTKVDYFEYSKDDLGLFGKLVLAMHNWLGEGNYGWTVVLFTVFLKIVMLPLDFWQRYSSRKSSLKMQKIQPLMQEIDKRYGANTQRANMEKQKITQKQGFSAFSMCLPMIISMVIFFVMFGGLRNYSTYCSVTNFQSMVDNYIEGYYDAASESDRNALEAEYNRLLAESTDKTERAKETNARLGAIDELQTQKGYDACEAYRNAGKVKVQEYYNAHHESWLWIQNVWQPDTWANVMPNYSDRNNGFSTSVNMKDFGNGSANEYYNIIQDAVLQTGTRGNKGAWNGLMILPVMSIGLSFLSIFLSQKMEKKSRNGGEEPAQKDPQQAATNTTMMIMMPLMMAFFGFMYTGAFAIYMVCNYALSILSTIALRLPVEKMVEKSLVKEETKEKSSKASYMR